MQNTDKIDRKLLKRITKTIEAYCSEIGDKASASNENGQDDFLVDWDEQFYELGKTPSADWVRMKLKGFSLVCEGMANDIESLLIEYDVILQSLGGIDNHTPGTCEHDLLSAYARAEYLIRSLRSNAPEMISYFIKTYNLSGGSKA